MGILQTLFLESHGISGKTPSSPIPSLPNARQKTQTQTKHHIIIVIMKQQHHLSLATTQIEEKMNPLFKEEEPPP
ncbi:hypothetical protein SESBI_02581 [Sesbania bispinosa]|nr:hypothetical protein SESBI_02581 [Sesbania bispinosa]